MFDLTEELIGERLDIALEKLKNIGYEIVLQANKSDKQKNADENLITAVFFDGKSIKLVYSDFLTCPLETKVSSGVCLEEKEEKDD